MKAVILAAGKGTRMGELTNEVPKPMLRVQHKPILQHIIEGLKETGIREICIITGFQADVIESFFGNGSEFGVEIVYRRQIVQDGTGKAPELAKDFVGSDSFLLTYGDILVKPETYAQMVDRFLSDNFDALVTATQGEEITKGGFLIFDKDFLLNALVEKPSAEDIEKLRQKGQYKDGDPVWYNAGIYNFTADVFSYIANLEISPRGEYELTDAISAMLANGRKITGMEIKGRWVDVRDPVVLGKLESGSFD